ncbi:MAG: ATP-binding protein, partial [Candidatus Aminicenantes bacterium]
NAALARLPGDILLSRTAALTDKPFDWDLVRFGSASLNNQHRQSFLDGLFILPRGWKRRWKSRFPAEPRFDTPVRAACAGFWFWHIKETAKAVEAFSVVKELTHGLELYGIAQTISRAQKATDLQTIADWEHEMNWMNTLSHPALRPGTLETLRTLRASASEARVALHSQAPLNRSTAIGRAVADITRLLETGETTCPEPEWPIIKEIAEKWRDIFSKAGGVVGEDVLRQPVLNPYEGYSGLPVTGSTFIGRADIMQRIENHWATTGQPAAIILYGHRRMGKTSILRSLANRIDSNTLYVYLDMQNVGWVDHTGQLLLDFAEAIHRTAVDAGLQSHPPKEDSYTNLGTGRRALNALLDKLNPQMTEPKQLVLAVDEFELIETGIQEKRINPGLLPYLRSINQKYQWLGLIFAGLHTLDEMGRDYQSAFYGQAEYLRVGYLDYNDAVQLITQPHPDFALEYAPGLLEEIYGLTSGQPYLIQRLCWELVTRWNERFLKQGESTPRILTPDDLEPVLTPDFFHSAGYYFEGVWSNVTENERTLMRIMAEREKGNWTIAELADAVGTKDLEKTIELLLRHDVILEEKGGKRIASELMRRWIASGGQGENKEDKKLRKK